MRSSAMTKRIIAIAFIFVCTSVAWAILGGPIFSRTYGCGSVSQDKVASTWGTTQNQGPPAASFKTLISRPEETLGDGKKVVKTVQREQITNRQLRNSTVHVD